MVMHRDNTNAYGGVGENKKMDKRGRLGEEWFKGEEWGVSIPHLLQCNLPTKGVKDKENILKS